MEQNNIFNRLHDQEVAPPPGMWNRIAQKLDEEEQSIAPVVTMPAAKPSSNWLKIAVAASFIGFVTMSVLWFTERSKKNNDSVVADNINNTTPTTSTTIPKDTPSVAAVSNVPVNTTTSPNYNVVVTPVPNTVIANNNKNKITKPITNTVTNPTQQTYLPDVQLPPVKTNDVANTNPTITINDANGNPIRNIDVVKSTDPSTIAGPISQGDKAIGNIIAKISLSSDKEEIDSIINNSAYWKKQIQEWRIKLIKSGYTPNLINHLDIMELKKLMDEKK